MGDFDLLDAWPRWFDLTRRVIDLSQRPHYADVVVAGPVICFVDVFMAFNR